MEGPPSKCRACLNEDGNMNVIFSCYDGTTTYAQILQEMLGLPLVKEQEYSDRLCQGCTQLLLDFKRFKALFEQATEYFKSKVSESCDETYTSLDDSPTQKSINEPNSETIPCKICKKMFLPEVFDNHYETHKIHECKACGHKFVRKTDLNDHEEIHADAFKYVCQYCGKAFKVRTALNKHRRIHTNPREEVCDVCGQRFNTRDTLKTHYKLKHIKSKDFQCNLCGLAFTLKSTLGKHIERHNPNRTKTYSCSTCGASYINKYNLSRHHLIKHMSVENRPSCDFCGKTYTKKVDLVKHVKKLHGV